MALKKISGVKVEPLILPSYLAIIESSVGSPMFRTFFAKVNGKKMDVLRGGRVSCSFYTSSILKLFNLTQEVQITITRLKLDMEKSGWYEISRPKKGCVVFWKEKPADVNRMKKDTGVYQAQVKHCGFFIGNGVCVSNGGDDTMAPWKHAITYRPIEIYMWHDALDADFKQPAKASSPRKAGIYWHPNK